jgi:putative tricarboxylic transport membrane protein
MTLERAIGLVFLVFCLAYGYTAFFGMDQFLPPILRRAPIWPSTFPKILSVIGTVTALIVIVNSGPSARPAPVDGEIDYRRLTDYKLGQAVALIGAMVLYALVLRPIGFIAATTLFLAGGAFILGERKYHWMVLTGLIASGGIWYLVQVVLGIFLSPWPAIGF